MLQFCNKKFFLFFFKKELTKQTGCAIIISERGKQTTTRKEVNKMIIISIIFAIIVAIIGINQLTYIAKETLKERKEKKAWKEVEERLAEDWKNKTGVYSYLKK